ncbi:MAG: MFS transporter [Alteromonadaceae bacterium]|nr:MFS transporter [Alteromonadaceae bacterium]
MFSNIVFALILLVLTTFVLAKYIKLPRNIWLLFMAQPLAMSASPIIVFIGAILSTSMASDPSLATLPITMMILGIASTSIPAALIAKKKGRKFATFTGFFCLFIASMLALVATKIANFELFVLASTIFGAGSAFSQQIRFAAIESTDNKDDIPKVLSILMFSGLFAAFLGPEIAFVAKDLLISPYGYSGSFLVLGFLIIFAMILMIGFKNPKMNDSEDKGEARPLLVIIKQPIFIVSILSATIGSTLMSYLMTATPLSMHQIHGHDLIDTKWVIQSHIAAMFLPSLFTAWLVKKFGLKSLMFAGTTIYAGVAFIALSGQQVMHFWWALILLGIGWNFLFLTGTTLLPLSYKPSERHKIQAVNDFILFGFQAFASLMAGWVLLKAGWNVVVYTSMPFILILFTVTIYFYRREKKLLDPGS